MKKLVPISVLLLYVALMSGCGGPQRPPGLPQLYDCALTFQFADGSPVNSAGVTLVPENATLGQWSISGTTDSAGTAKIYTSADFAGAPAGKYKILVRKEESVPTDKKDEYGDPITNIRSLVSEQYANPASTPLTLEIADKAVKETFKVEKAK